MYLLYVDESGSVDQPDDEYFVLSGICIFERQVHYLNQALDDLAARIYPEAPESLEFHGSHMLAGKGVWRSFDKAERRTHIRHALATCRVLRGDWALFGMVIEKRSVSPHDPMDFAFGQLITRFDSFLKRQYKNNENPQRGLMILDKPKDSRKEPRLQQMAVNFRRYGHGLDVTRNIAEVPLFVDSKATRLIQFADLTAYALFQKYERHNTEFFDVIKTDFDSSGGIVHGLLHQHSGKP